MISLYNRLIPKKILFMSIVFLIGQCLPFFMVHALSTNYGGEICFSNGLTIDATQSLKTNKIESSDPTAALLFDSSSTNSIVFRRTSSDQITDYVTINTSGISVVGGDFAVSGATTLTGSTLMNANATINGDLTIGNSSTFYGDVKIGGTSSSYGSLTSSASVLFKNALNVTASSVFTGPVSVLSLQSTGSGYFGGVLTISGTSTMQGNIGASNRVDITGQLGVGGPTTVTSLATSGSGIVGTTFTVSGSLTSAGNLLAQNRVDVTGQLGVTNATSLTSLITTGTVVLGRDLTVANSSSLLGDVLIGRTDRTYGSLTLTSSALFNKALQVTGSSVFAAPVTLLSTAITGSEIIGDALTVSGTTSFNEDVSIFNNKNLIVTGTITHGSNGTVKIFGQKLLTYNITSATTTTTALSVNFTTSYASARISVFLFGGCGAGDVLYVGSYFVTPNSAASTVAAQSTTPTAGGSLAVSTSFIRRPDIQAVHIFLAVTAGRVITSPCIHYEVSGNYLASVT